MRIIVFIIAFLFSTNCYAELWRYTDKATGEEMGIRYSDTPLVNPNWNSEIIPESRKNEILEKIQKQNIKKKEDADKDLDKKKKNCASKLKTLGLDKDDINILLGDNYGD